jgi:hypothetical protein
MNRRVVVAGLACCLIGAPAFGQSPQYQRGYTRRDGTYVAPHMRTRPDGNPWNNYSTRGNVNPYTGRGGTVDPYRPPSYGGRRR